MREKPIAVFDSGLGGLSVLRALRSELPQEDFLYFGDSANAPYGSRSTEEIRELTMIHAENLLRRAKALVIACNTATSAAVDVLRASYPDRIIIGIEPALKPALQAVSDGQIAVMATEATLRERKFAALTEQYAADGRIVKCPCPELVEFVERGELHGKTVEAAVRAALAPVLLSPPEAVVLGCTHFPFLRGAIEAVLGKNVLFFDGAEGTARETRRRLEEAGLLRVDGGAGSIRLENSGDAAFIERSEQLLGLRDQPTARK